MLERFFFHLRAQNLPVTPAMYLELTDALSSGIAGTLDELYLAMRLILIRRVGDYDAYDRAFLLWFFGIAIPGVAEGDPQLFHTKEFAEWLKEARRTGQVNFAGGSLSLDELMRRFWDTVRQQLEAHNGGSRWIGTGGTSPFGHSGAAQPGLRVYGSAGSFSAIKVIAEKRYTDYSADRSIDGHEGRALQLLKRLTPVRHRSELDIPATVSATARAAGEIDLRFRYPLQEKLRVTLLLDNGGYSMTPYITQVRKLFARLRERFRSLDSYYFHNTVYEYVSPDPARATQVSLASLADQARENPDGESLLLVVGDASMAPSELTSPWGAIHYGDESPVVSSDQWKWLRRRFDAAIWLNPIPRSQWRTTRGAWTIARIASVIPMFDMSLRGIRDAVAYLNQDARHY